MSVIPHSSGYLVTDGISRVRSFDIANYPSKWACREDAITFSHETRSRNDSDITDFLVTYLLIEV